MWQAVWLVLKQLSEKLVGFLILKVNEILGDGIDT